jgi:hypothetical protein
MATRDRPPPAAAAGDDQPAAAGRDEGTEQALARSRGIREQANRRIQAAREHLATARRRRFGPSAGSWPAAQVPAAQPAGGDEEIERSRRARARLAEMAATLAESEQTVVRIHDEMARRDSRHAAQYRRTADDARQAARRARDNQRDADPGPG